MPDAGVFPGADPVFDPGVDVVGGVDVGELGAPAAQVRGQVGDVQAVTPAVAGFEEGQLGAGVRALAAGEDPHGRWPAGELVTGRARAQQPGQLGDVGFLDPAAAMSTVGVLAGVIGAALAHLTSRVDSVLPGISGDQADRGALALAQVPSDRVGQLAAGAAAQLIQVLDQPWLAPAPSQVTISLRRCFAGTAVIAASRILR